MNWGKSIVLSFVLFAVFIGVLVTVCIKQDTPLVSKAYYQEELTYDKQLARMNNTQALRSKPEIMLDGKVLRVSYASFSKIAEGKLKLFRPSDASLDRLFEVVAVSDSQQFFAVEDLEKGLYQAQFTWQQDGKEYYFEKTIVL
jgi:hypothetical protein